MTTRAMRVLVLGGTRFVGRHIVDALRASGLAVTVLTRGLSPVSHGADVERLRGNRNDGDEGLAALAGRTWEACVDVSGYTPVHVRSAVERLRGQVDRYVFISTVSVYDLTHQGPVAETTALLPAAPEAVTAVTGETYGPLKVACEAFVRDAFDARAVILRPQIVAGPFDPTGRHTYWVQRAMHGGDIAAPGAGDDHVQVVDARDLARFAARCVTHALAGVFNVAGPRLTWRAFMDRLGVEHPVWVPAAAIRAAGVSVTELPLFIEDSAEYSGIMHVDAARAQGVGFAVSDPSVTIEDTRAWLRMNPVTPALSAERERELVALARR